MHLDVAQVVVDDLDVANGPGARNRFRWQDVDELLAGIVPRYRSVQPASSA